MSKNNKKMLFKIILNNKKNFNKRFLFVYLGMEKEYLFRKDYTSFSKHFNPSYANKGDLFVLCEDGWYKHLKSDRSISNHWRVDPDKIKEWINEGVLSTNI